MQSWLSKAADLLIHDRLIWVKNWPNIIYLRQYPIVLLIIRDGFAYFFIFQAILNNRIEISQFVFYFGAITGFSAFVTGLTNDFAYISKNSKEVTAFRDYLEIDTSYHTGQARYLPSGDPLCIELINLSFRLEKDSPYILKTYNIDYLCDSGNFIKRCNPVFY